MKMRLPCLARVFPLTGSGGDVIEHMPDASRSGLPKRDSFNSGMLCAAGALENDMPMTKKEALLKAAKELFGECGYAETTFKKISERAGVALGLLTHHYGNKEKLFLAAGMDVLDHFLAVLRDACATAGTGREGVLHFCRAYLDFSVDPASNWLVLVRCSPYSDMKTSADRELMFRKFNEVHQVLEQELWRGIEDGSIRELPVSRTVQIIMSLVVGVNRTRVLTPYAPERLYEEAVEFVARAITPCSACE